MSTALVTGFLGFLGRHFRTELKARNYAVLGWDLPEWDVMNMATRQDLDYEKVDLLVHCAYQVGGRAGIDGKNLNLATNVQLDAAMFQWAVKNARRMIYFSSSTVYQTSLQTEAANKRNVLRLNEDEVDLDSLVQPDADYGWAKLTGERLARKARQQGLQVTVVRPFSGYGEDQSLDYPFPAIVKRASEGDLTVWGPRGQMRDWVHVDDVVNGTLAVADSGTTDPVNICSGYGTEMGTLAWEAYRMAGRTEKRPVFYDEDKPTGVYCRVGDPTRFNQFYQPRISLEEGIRRALGRQ